jgi:hypothetical protein
MLRRIVVCALALVALASLEGCGVNRLTGPRVDVATRSGALGDPLREDPGTGPEPRVDPVATAPTPASDTLRTGGDDNGRPRTD